MSSPPPQAPSDRPASFAAPYAVPSPGVLPEQPAPRPTRTLGILALTLALVALVGSATAAALASARVAAEGRLAAAIGEDGLQALSPVREWVLLGEIGFWAGMVVGFAALVLGVVAIVRARGRGFGIAAVIAAVAVPVVFALVIGITLVVTTSA